MGGRRRRSGRNFVRRGRGGFYLDGHHRFLGLRFGGAHRSLRCGQRIGGSTARHIRRNDHDGQRFFVHRRLHLRSRLTGASICCEHRHNFRGAPGGTMLTRRIYAVKPRIGGSGAATVRGRGGGILGGMRRRHGIGQERNDMFFGLRCRLGSICCRANGSGFTQNGGRWNNRHRRRTLVQRGIHHGPLAGTKRARGNRHNPSLRRCCSKFSIRSRHTHRHDIVHFVAHSRHLPIRGVRFVRLYGIIRGISPSTIGTEALIERASQLLHPFFRIEKALFFGI